MQPPRDGIFSAGPLATPPRTEGSKVLWPKWDWQAERPVFLLPLVEAREIPAAAASPIHRRFLVPPLRSSLSWLPEPHPTHPGATQSLCPHSPFLPVAVVTAQEGRPEPSPATTASPVWGSLGLGISLGNPGCSLRPRAGASVECQDCVWDHVAQRASFRWQSNPVLQPSLPLCPHSGQYVQAINP